MRLLDGRAVALPESFQWVKPIHPDRRTGTGDRVVAGWRTTGRRWPRLGISVLAGALLLLVAALSVGAEAAPDGTDATPPASPAPDLTAQVPASAPDPAAQARRALAEDVVRLTNEARAKEGLGPLQPNDRLTQAAQTYAQAMAPGDCFSHDCPPTPSQKDRIAQAGYGGWKRIGENIAAGDRTAEFIVSGWMDSPGHRANILKPEYTEIGVGVANGDGKYRVYWVQMFATPSE
jgi:uncharacterized protein YkwD